MFRTYSISEVERICGVSRRTVSEYVSKGLLSGPSHRGRGARYPQADVDALKLLPRFRTLMKREFPNLKTLAAFLRQLSIRDLHLLAGKTSESSFVLEVRRLRVRNNLAALAPHVAPEHIETMLAELTPGQIRAIDSGRYQIGAVLDIGALLQQSGGAEPAVTRHNNNGKRRIEQERIDNEHNGHAVAAAPSVSVNWLEAGESGHLSGSALAPEDIGSLDEVVTRMESRAAARLAAGEPQPDLQALVNGSVKSDAGPDRAEHSSQSLGQRINDISQRLERLESMLAHD